MQRRPRRLGKGGEPFLEKLCIEIPQLRAGEIHLPHQIGTARQINGDAGQRFIHRDIGMTIALNPLAIAQGLDQGFTNHIAGIFGRVVVINVQIPLGPQRQVNQTVLGQLLQHMIQEPNTGCDVIAPFPIDSDGA